MEKERLVPIDDVTTINAIHVYRENKQISFHTRNKTYDIPYNDDVVYGIKAILKIAKDEERLAYINDIKSEDIAHVGIGFNGQLMEVYTRTYDRIAVLSGNEVAWGLECLVHTANGVFEDVINDLYNKIFDKIFQQ